MNSARAEGRHQRRTTIGPRRPRQPFAHRKGPIHDPARDTDGHSPGVPAIAGALLRRCRLVWLHAGDRRVSHAVEARTFEDTPNGRSCARDRSSAMSDLRVSSNAAGVDRRVRDRLARLVVRCGSSTVASVPLEVLPDPGLVVHSGLTGHVRAPGHCVPKPERLLTARGERSSKALVESPSLSYPLWSACPPSPISPSSHAATGSDIGRTDDRGGVGPTSIEIRTSRASPARTQSRSRRCSSPCRAAACERPCHRRRRCHRPRTGGAPIRG